jgi:hypothetical protein
VVVLAVVAVLASLFFAAGARAAGATVEVVLPDGTLAARSGPDASFFDFPRSSGVLVHVGDIRRDGGLLRLTDVSLLGGAVAAVQVIVPVRGTRGLAVAGLIVRGVVVDGGVNSIYGLRDGSYAIAAQAAVLSGHTGVVGLRLHLSGRHGRLPAGSEILVGLPGMAEPDHSHKTLSVLGLADIIGGALQPVTAGAGYVYPLAVRGRVIGCPFVPGSTHSPFAWPNNLASDDAIDIAVPVGTPVLAVAAGTIGALIGPLRPGRRQPRRHDRQPRSLPLLHPVLRALGLRSNHLQTTIVALREWLCSPWSPDPHGAAPTRARRADRGG